MKQLLGKIRIKDQLILIVFSIIALFPIIIILMNSFKSRTAIFKTPYQLPSAETLSLVGYETVQSKANFGLYYMNSLIVTIGAILFIILFGSMVAFAFSQYEFRLKKVMKVFFLLGILIPIRLGSVSILNIILSLNLIDTLTALILVYIAQGLPMAILILSSFMETIPRELIDAARIDGANEFLVYKTILPLIFPALGTVSAFTMLPIWNDLWFPLILIYAEEKRTVTLGTLQFMGQFSSDWNALLAALTIAIVPVLIMYFVFSRKILGNMTLGAIK
jgi:raffinose/stachyose/melibiose transport system permease protein